MSKEPLVLVVDDDQHLGEFLQMALGKDWRVILAEDGLQAVEWPKMDSRPLNAREMNLQI
jgi:DNA-binding response OmpR family regulator